MNSLTPLPSLADAAAGSARDTRAGSCSWGRLPDGSSARLFTLRNPHGMKVSISDLGATLVSWQAPDRNGRLGNILLGHDTPGAYLRSNAYMGALVGRWANRIAGARFSLDGVEYVLDRNEGKHLLHGGSAGFHRALWQAEEQDGALVMQLASPEGEAGFPGNVHVRVRYSLDEQGTLTIAYEATSDATTPFNLTSHPYFNLSARPNSDIRGHVVRIAADDYFEVDAELIPLRRASVTGSAFDFRQGAPLGARLDWPHEQLALAGGFDHCFVVDEAAESGLAERPVRPVASVYDPGSGRELIVATDQPGLQFYTGNQLANEGRRPHGALCLEAGAFPNQINMASAAAVLLHPGQIYRQETHYRVGVRD